MISDLIAPLSGADEFVYEADFPCVGSLPC